MHHFLIFLSLSHLLCGFKPDCNETIDSAIYVLNIPQVLINLLQANNLESNLIQYVLKRKRYYTNERCSKTFNCFRNRNALCSRSSQNAKTIYYICWDFWCNNMKSATDKYSSRILNHCEQCCLINHADIYCMYLHIYLLYAYIIYYAIWKDALMRFIS